MARLTMTTTTFEARDGYEGRDYEVGATNGAERVSISMRPLDSLRGLGASMTPTEARRLAADLTARADEIDDRPEATA